MNFKTFILLLTSLGLMAETLENVVVSTGTRTNKILSEAPIKTEVVSKKEIQKMHAKNVSEAIKYIPGLLIKETHGKQGQSVSIQGFDSDRVLILIDGEPMTSSTGQTVDLSQLDVSNVESIEIIKGAASALYGSQAMGGVINIKTTLPESGVHNTASLELGSHMSKSADDIPITQLKFSSTYKEDKLVASIYADYRHDSGVKLEEGYRYDLPELDRLNLNAELRYIDDIDYYIRSRIYLEDSMKPFTRYSPGFGYIKNKKTEEAQKYRLSTGAKTELNNGDNIKFTAFGERYYDTTDQDVLATSYLESTRDALIDMAQADFQYDTTLGESHLLTMGALLKYQALEQEELKNSESGSEYVEEITGNASSYAYEAYIQDDWFITDNLELLPGLRYQYDSDFGSYVSPKLSLLYTPYQKGAQRLNIRSSYGNGYRAPSIKERYFNFDHSQYGYMVLGNPYLEPESSHSYQLSFEWIDSNSFNTALNFYYNDITDLIDTQKNVVKSIVSGLEIHEYVNVNSAQTAGLELSGSINFMQDFLLSGGYTYLYSEDKETKNTLTQRPEHQLKATLTYDTKDFNAMLSYIYESEEYVDSENKLTSPAATQIDVKMTKYVTKLLSFYLGINNLLDEHQDVDDPHDLRTKRSRYIYMGTNYNF